jgi:hypothetical protein
MALGFVNRGGWFDNNSTRSGSAAQGCAIYCGSTYASIPDQPRHRCPCSEWATCLIDHRDMGKGRAAANVR